MHELPSDLAHSLRSWRGSVYGNPQQDDDDLDVDLEKGRPPPKVYQFDEALNSSMVLHPMKTQRRDNASHSRSRSQVYSQAHSRAPSQAHSQAHSRAPSQAYSQTHPHSSPEPPDSPDLKKDVFGAAPEVEDPDPAASRLDDEKTPLTSDDFYYLIGMNPPTTHRQNPKELRMSHGLYGKIWFEYEFVQSKYRLYDVLTYVFLILQIFLSAVFIVLGSVPNAHGLAISLLGAVSTIIAGILALMKGQGLPNRLRQQRDSLRNVIFEAEELYWDVNARRCVYFSDIKKIREDFLRVLEQARRNHPDTWNAIASGIAQGLQSKTKLSSKK